jgi:hypothetical protein
MNRSLARIVISAALLNSAACVSVTTPRFMMPTAQREWKPTLEEAHRLAAAGRAPQADSLLAAYASNYAGTDGAREALYWRSLIQLQSGFVSENGPARLLDQYLAAENSDHRIEAATLRRIATRVDSLSRAAVALQARMHVSDGEIVSANSRVAADAKAATADAKDQDAEIKKLKGELAAAREELERIKKRLAEPAKKPPIR